MISSLIRHREYIWRNALLDLRNRHAGSGLGSLWLLLFPLAQIVIFSIVFSRIAQAKLEALADVPLGFTLYLCAGLLPWTGFAETVTEGTDVLNRYSEHLTRHGLPEQVLFARDALAGLLAQQVRLVLLLLAALLFGLSPTRSWLSLPLVLTLFTGFAWALSMVFGALNVFTRDVGQAVSIGLQLSVWTTPIVYPESILPEGARNFLVYNPLYWFIDAIHGGLLFGSASSLRGWLIMGMLGIGGPLAAYLLVRKLRPALRDLLT